MPPKTTLQLAASPAQTPADSLTDSLEALESALRQLRASDGSGGNTSAVDVARCAAAGALARLPRHQATRELADRVLALARALRDVPSIGSLHATEPVLLSAGERGWPAVTARMLLAEAWRCAGAPLLSEVPDWMWGDYAEWIFSPPSRCCSAAEWDAFATHVAPHLEELNRWLKRNAGSVSVRAAIGSYLRVSKILPPQTMTHGGRCAASLRGEFLARNFTERMAATVGPALPRVGRRLRVGFVHSRFGPDADLRRVLPAYSHLDSRRFETILISCSADDAELARASRGSERECHVLPVEFRDRIAQLRSVSLDVVVFFTDLGTRLDDVTRLASQRVAPLQIANHRSGVSTGLPEIDLYVMPDRPDAAESARQFTERLGLLRGPGVSFAIPATPEDASTAVSRESLGLPEETPLFGSVVTAGGVSLETLALWARVLAQSPESRLAVARLTDELADKSAQAVTAFGRVFDGVLRAHGIASNRVSIFPAAASAVPVTRELLRRVDVYLESLDGVAPEWVAEALAAGRPALALAGENAARSAELVRAVGVPELVAPDAESYVRLAAKLARDPEWRGSIGARIAAVVARGGGFLDLLGAADAFGALVETAFDERAALGQAQFRAQREPLRCFAPDDVTDTITAGEAALASGDHETAAAEAGLALRGDPLNVAARMLYGRALLAEGDAARAITYLLAAVDQRSDDAELWFTLAGALRQNQQTAEALQALETSLRLDRMRVDGWFMLLDIAEGVGAAEIARDALDVLRELVPEDPRVAATA